MNQHITMKISLFRRSFRIIFEFFLKILRILKFPQIEKSKFVYRVNDSDYVSKILNEKIIVLDQLDINSKQSYNSFIYNLSYSIKYSSDDFLILIDKESDRILQNDGMLELDKVIQFGWYYENTHKVNYKLLELTESKKLENLKTLNPNIIINSFDKYRKPNRMIKYINVLSGAFGLCYYTFKDEYDNFFKKSQLTKIDGLSK